jgi:hypothetical protein
MKKKISLLIREEGGAITVMAVIMIFAFLGILAVVLDLGHLHTVQNELRNAADACALRGARGFFDDNLTGVSATPPDKLGAISKASAAIGDNKSDNVALVNLPEEDITAGIWDFVNRQLLTWEWPPDPVWWGKYIGPGIRVPTQKTDSYNAGPVTMTLAPVFNIIRPDEDFSKVSVKTNATAALSGFGGPLPESPIMPFGPMAPPPDGGNFTGYFRNDNNDTVGWSNLQGVPEGEKTNKTSASDLFKLIAGTASPDAGGDHPIVSINNGQIASAIGKMTDKDNPFGLVETGEKTNIFKPTATGTNADGVPYAEATYLLPVFDKALLDGDTQKFNQAAVVGGVMVKLVEVGTSPYNYITVEIQTGTYVAPGYPGGAWYGVLSPQPLLVQ